MTGVLSERPFRIRWLGKVRYRDALVVQQRIHGQFPAAPQDREERASQDDDSQPSRLLPDFVPRGNAGPGLDLFFCAEVCTQNLAATGLLPRVVLPAELHDGVPAGPGVCARRGQW